MNYRQKRRALIYFINSVVFGIVVMFQACSKNYDVSLQQTGLPPKCKQGICDTLQMNPAVEQLRPSTKVLFVVDNSRTMALSQEYLRQGVKALAKDIRGFDADFFIQSTSDVHSKRIDANGNQINRDDKPVVNATKDQKCTWKEIVDGKEVEKTSSGCPNDQKSEYKTEQSLVMNPSLGGALKFQSKMTDQELDLMSDQLGKSITDVGIDGTSTETGICSLVRSVYNESTSRMFNQNDNAVMVVISDEDDSSSSSQCLSQLTQKERFDGRPAETQACNPLTEKCQAVDYKVDFKQQYQTVNVANYKVDYKCETLGSNNCAQGQSCEKVTYTFNNLRAKVNYSCGYVEYAVKFNANTVYSRNEDFSCFSKVPYTIAFNNNPTYTQNMNFKCEKLEDGVPVGVSDLKSVALNNVAAACTDGSEVDCNTNDLADATNRCGAGFRLYANSCKRKCVVGSVAVANQVFNDTDSSALTRDLTTTSFQKDGVTYQNLYDWAAQKITTATVKTNGISQGTSDSGASSLALTTETSACTNGEIVDCDANHVQQAVNKCGTLGKQLIAGKCKVKCNVTNPTHADFIYQDNRNNADAAHLESESFVPPGTSTSYANVGDWAVASVPGWTVASITRTGKSTTAIEKFENLNCSSYSPTGATCDSAETTFASTQCGTRKVSSCAKKCLKDYKSLVLTSPKTDDTANFCTNTDTSQTFSATTGAAGTYSSIQSWASASIFAGQQASITDCSRIGDGYTSIAQTSINLSVDNQVCSDVVPVDVLTNLNNQLSTKCAGTNPKQNGVTSGSRADSCTNSTKQNAITGKGGDSATYTQLNPEIVGDYCAKEIIGNTKTYTGIKGMLADNKNRLNEADTTCAITGARKTVVPAGVMSIAKVNEQWTFPKTVLASAPEANLEKAFVDRSRAMFGDNGFFVSAIIRDAEEEKDISTCAPLGADQSFGQKYKSLVAASSSNSSLAKGDVTSICETDYSKALHSVGQWIRNNALRTVFLPNITAQNEILAVSLVKDTGEELALVVGRDYEVVGNKLNFINPDIDPLGWQIKYVLWSPKPEGSAVSGP